MLRAANEAVAIIRVNDQGELVYQNPAAKTMLCHYSTGSESSAVCLKDWRFESATGSGADGDDAQDWSALLQRILAGTATLPTGDDIISATASIPMDNATITTSSKSKRILIRFQPVPTSGCSCGCGAKYAVAYLTCSENPKDDKEKASWESHQRLQATVDASFDAMFTIDQTGVILMTNPAAVQLFGYDSQDDFVGHNVSMICGHEHADQHNDYLRHYWETGVTKIMGTKRRVLAQRRDGTEFPVELGLVELPSPSSHERYFSAFVKDLSGQEQHQAQILEQASLTQALINASFDPMIQIDQRGKIQIVNEAAVNLFGYSREELLGANIATICGGEHGAHHDEYLGRYLETGQKRVIGRKQSTVARRKDGTEFPIELGIQQVLRDNGEWVFCGFIRDLTSQQKLKESLQRQDQWIHNQFFGTTTGDGESQSDAGSTTSAGQHPRRPPRHRRADTAP